MTEQAAPPGDKRLHEVAEAVRGSRLHDAISLARRYLDEGLVHPLLLNLRAYWHEKEGRLKASLSDLEQARTLAPNDPIILNAFGLCCVRLNRVEEAIVSFDAAIAAEPSFTHAHFSKAVACEMIGDLDIARRHYEHAVAITPNHADALANLAWLAARRADWSEARASAEQAIAVNPAQSRARLAMAAVELGRQDALEAEKRIAELLADERLVGVERGLALGLLGDCLEHQERYDSAFETYTKSNLEFRNVYSQQFAAPGKESYRGLVERLTGCFNRARAEDWAPSTSPPDADVARSHVFLVGFPRSGTTLLEQILASNPDVASVDEKETLAQPMQEFMLNGEGLDRLRNMASAELEAHRQRYWAKVRNSGIEPRGKIFIDKLALHSIKLPLIARLFPRAKIMLALRDPRDVVWSCFKQRFGVNPATFEFLTADGAARFYDATMTLVEVYRSKLPLDLFVSRYEDLVTDFEPHARKVCNFLGIEWTDAMRNFSDRARVRSISTPSSTQVARGLYTSGIGQWKRYERPFGEALEVILPWVRRFNYN